MKKIAFLGIMILGIAAAAMATPTLSLQSGGAPIVIENGSLLDLNGDANAVTFIGAVGLWNMNVSTGVSDPSGKSILDLNSVNNTNSNQALPLTIEFGDNNFMIPAPGFVMAIGGTLEPGWDMMYQVYLDDAANSVFGMTNEVGTININLDPFKGSLAGPGPNSSPYALTLKVVIDPNGIKGSASFDAKVTPVPEPGSALLLGAGLVGLGFWVRRNRK